MNTTAYVLHGGTGRGAKVLMRRDASTDDYRKLEAAFRKQANLPENRTPYIAINRYEETAPESVKYRWWLESSQGGGYEILYDPSVTRLQVNKTKQWMRRQFDVVTLQVVHITEYIEMPADENGIVLLD